MAKLPSEFTFIERGYFNGNNILIEGTGRPVIVDTGHFLSRDETLALIRQHGVEPETLEMIVSTHCHSDHHGANRLLKAISGAPIGLGALTARWFAENEQRLTWFDQIAQEVDIALADITFEHGDEITLSGLPFQVIGLPGHAPDCVGFYQPDTKLLISADALWANDLGVLNVEVHGWGIVEDAALALSRIKALDVEMAIPGHGGLIFDVDAAIEQIERRLERFRQSPETVGQHLTRRFLMYELLCVQPIERDKMIDLIETDGWIYTYLPYLDRQLEATPRSVSLVV
ncbi:MAG: MBL fold metallo-hydrolase, partial [Chloroflexota bacterium]